MSIVDEKGSIRPSSPEEEVCLSQGPHWSWACLTSGLPTASLCPHPRLPLQGGGSTEVGLAFPRILRPAQDWGPKHKGLIRETDVNAFQTLEAEGQGFQASEGRWGEERPSPR